MHENVLIVCFCLAHVSMSVLFTRLCNVEYELTLALFVDCGVH